MDFTRGVRGVVHADAKEADEKFSHGAETERACLGFVNRVWVREARVV